MRVKHTPQRYIESDAVEQSYTAKDTILYALGLGLGADPLDEREWAVGHGPWCTDRGTLNFPKTGHFIPPRAS